MMRENDRKKSASAENLKWRVLQRNDCTWTIQNTNRSFWTSLKVLWTFNSGSDLVPWRSIYASLAI